MSGFSETVQRCRDKCGSQMRWPLFLEPLSQEAVGERLRRESRAPARQNRGAFTSLARINFWLTNSWMLRSASSRP